MRILDICPFLPYPPIDGGRKAVFHAMRSLAARGHSIRLLCLSDSLDQSAVQELQRVFSVDVVFHSSKPSALGALISLPNRTPYQLSRFHTPALLAKARSLLESSSFDILQVESINMVYYALHLGAEYHIPAVLRSLDHMPLKLSRDIEYARNPLMRLWLKFDLRRLQAYERSACARMSSNMMISEIERDLLKKEVPRARCDYVPTGVDLTEFAPLPLAEDHRTILWLGSLFWPPNRDSFWWFYNEIVPEIIRRFPDAMIRVVGSGAPSEILGIRHPNVEIRGYVPDIRQLMARSEVCVVPLRVGSGVRVKLLEMFAMRRAVVSTSVGAEGLSVIDGNQLLIADSPKVFADKVARLLDDSALRERMGRSAREHVERYHSWEEIGSKFEEVYRSLAATGGGKTEMTSSAYFSKT